MRRTRWIISTILSVSILLGACSQTKDAEETTAPPPLGHFKMSTPESEQRALEELKVRRDGDGGFQVAGYTDAELLEIIHWICVETEKDGLRAATEELLQRQDETQISYVPIIAVSRAHACGGERPSA